MKHESCKKEAVEKVFSDSITTLPGIFKQSRKKLLFVLLLFLLSFFCFGKTIKKCPVEILDVWNEGQKTYVKIKILNSSRITGWVICGSFEESDEVFTFESKKELCGEGEEILEITFDFEEEEFHQIEAVFFRQIFFEDGSFWADPFGRYIWVKE